jgi:fatty acid desaturase
MARSRQLARLRRACTIRSATRLAVTLVLVAVPVVTGLLRPDLLAGPLVVLLMVVQVVALTGVSNAAHESVHGHLFHHPRMDRLAGRVLHGLLLLNHDVHRRYHLTHHAHLGQDEDTEGVFSFDDLDSHAAYVRRLARWSVPPSPLHVLNWREGVIAVRGGPGGLGRPIRPGRAAAGFVVPLLVVVALGAWLATDPRAALLAGVLPLLVAFPVYTYLTALPEHFGLAGGPHPTRNVRTARLLQYLLWNFNLHAVHHAHPNLHFSLLPAGVDDIDAPTAQGYLRFHRDVLRLISDPTPTAELLGVRR